MDKLITFGIPCYNSSAYMDHCITSILEGSNYAEDVQVVIVDDGSQKDDTATKADAWAAHYPQLIKAIHQENGGHGMAVLTGLAHADGIFYKVVDSDDWLDGFALKRLLGTLRTSEAAHEELDLIVTNYVYEHTVDNTSHTVDYRGVLPSNKVFSWDDAGHLQMSQSLLMHALTYRCSVLRDGGVPMPAHTFYVDNIYAWVPLPRVRHIRYVDADLYRYFIGREDQSVNESVMAGRIEQQVRITRIMMHAYHPYQDVHSVNLRSYMVNYFILMMAICSIFSRLSTHPNAMEECERLWHELYEYDYRLWRRCRLGLVGLLCNLPGEQGTKATLALYHLANSFIKFN